MDELFLSQLRCPLDPNREAGFTRDEQGLCCTRCSAHFPIKNGLAVLVPGEVELPEGLREVSQLPCQRAANREKNRK
jgi:uncharacterized protein YbaR (Trm112 family)